MKILEIIHGLPPGGAERLVVDLCNELAKDNDVKLLTLKDDKFDNMSFYLSDLSTNVRYQNLGFAKGFHWKYLWTMYKLIKKENPDIVHIHIVVEYCIIPILLLGNKVPFFQTIHIDIDKAFKSFSRKVTLYLLGGLKLLNYITISKTNYLDLKKKYPFCKNDLVYNGRAILQKTEKYTIVKNEIEQYKSNQDTVVFIHVARCVEQKNQKLLVESFNEICKRDINAILLIIGAGFDDSERGEYFKNIACKQVFFLGPKNNIADYFYNSDIFCLSSLFEGMPITLIEAMLCGIPTVSTPVCGVIDVVKTGENGIISKDFSKECYVDALLAGYNQRILLKDNIKRASGTNKFAIDTCAKNYLKIFQRNIDSYN